MVRRYEFYVRVARTISHERAQQMSENIIPTTFRRFPKISKIVLKARQTFPNIFREFSKISEDCQRLSRRTRRCFDDAPTNLICIIKRQT